MRDVLVLCALCFVNVTGSVNWKYGGATYSNLLNIVKIVKINTQDVLNGLTLSPASSGCSTCILAISASTSSIVLSLSSSLE